MVKRLSKSGNIARRFLENAKRYDNKGTWWGTDKKTGELAYLRIGRRKNEGISVRSPISTKEVTRIHKYGRDESIRQKTVGGKRIIVIIKTLHK